MRKHFPTSAQKKAKRQEQRKEQAMRLRMRRDIHAWDAPCSVAWPYRKRNSDQMRWDVAFEPTAHEMAQIGNGLIIKRHARVDVTCAECKAKLVEQALRSDADEPQRMFPWGG